MLLDGTLLLFKYDCFSILKCVVCFFANLNCVDNTTFFVSKLIISVALLKHQ